jgi:polar amino acid transport system permease protein
MDASEKPRIRRRGPLEYVAWAVCALVFLAIAHTVVVNPNYHWDVVGRYFTQSSVLKGLSITVFLTVITMVFGTLLGLLVAVLQASSIRPVTIIATAYVTFFRGTPVLVQLIFWFNVAALYPHIAIGLPFTGISHAVDVNALMGPLTAAIVGLSLNEAAYMAEIVRGGFAAVDHGQLEAADALGMSAATKMRKVIIPQAMPTIIPATGNQVIGMFKETSLVSVLGVAELLGSVQLIYSRTYETIPLLIVACLWYLVMTLALSYPQSLLEKRYTRSRNRGTATEQLELSIVSEAGK